LYENFEYLKPTNFFHTFEIHDTVAGFSFADEVEASQFYTKVFQFSNKRNPPSPPVKVIRSQPSAPTLTVPISNPSRRSNTVSGPSAGKEQSLKLSDLVQVVVLEEKKEEKKKRRGFLSGIFGKEEIDKIIISEPRDFRHTSSIGWNPNTGFEVFVNFIPNLTRSKRSGIFLQNGKNFFKQQELRRMNSKTKTQLHL
jgi:hypothetical protein